MAFEGGFVENDHGRSYRGEKVRWSSPRIGWKLVSQNFVFLCVRDATRDALIVVVCVFVRARRETRRVDGVVCVFVRARETRRATR